MCRKLVSILRRLAQWSSGNLSPILIMSLSISAKTPLNSLTIHISSPKNPIRPTLSSKKACRLAPYYIGHEPCRCIVMLIQATIHYLSLKFSSIPTNQEIIKNYGKCQLKISDIKFSLFLIQIHSFTTTIWNG